LTLIDAVFDPVACVVCGALTRLRCARCGVAVCADDACPTGCDYRNPPAADRTSTDDEPQ
jgi:hypothetical protein